MVPNMIGPSSRPTQPERPAPDPAVLGQLVPVGGGDTVPLVRESMTAGRRDICDICLRFPSVSGQHCRLYRRDGFWYVQDLGSTNGTRVNRRRVEHKLLCPGDELEIAKIRFKVQYEPPAGKPFPVEDATQEDVMSKSLMERAGLSRPRAGRRHAEDDE